MKFQIYKIKPTPEYKPLPKGVDVATQLEDRELFDFDLEAQPILQVLIGRCLENSKMELIEEYEKKMFEQNNVKQQQNIRLLNKKSNLRLNSRKDVMQN